MKAMEDLKVGDQVLIYEDPITKKCLEGKATIVRFITDDIEPNMLYAYVRFNGEEEVYRRALGLI